MKTNPWNRFNPLAYIQNNYARIHDEDKKIISYLVKFYKHIPQIKLALEIGVGPNLYPVMAMLPFVDKIECIDLSDKNIAYLRKQLWKLDSNWLIFWNLLKSLTHKYDVAIVRTLSQKVVVQRGNIFRLPESRYDLSSMFFCAESITNSRKKFIKACHKFILSVKPAGLLVAAFMENSAGYEIAGVKFPAYPINAQDLKEIFAAETTNLSIHRIPTAKQPLRPGYTGMLLLTATRFTPVKEIPE